MTIKIMLRTAGLVALIFHKVDGQNKKQIFYDDTQSNQYRPQQTSLTHDQSPFPSFEQPKLPPQLSASPSSYPHDPIHTSGGASYEPALPYAPPAPPQLPPPAPPAYAPPAAPASSSYSPPAAPYQPPANSYASPAPLPPYIIQPAYPAPAPAYPASPPAYDDSYIAPAPTGYDSYDPSYDGGGYGGYDNDYGKGYKKPYKGKGYHDILKMKKYYFLKIFGSLVKAKGAVLVGIGKLLKLKGKLLLAKGEALEDIGYYLKNIKHQHYAPSYGYGYENSYDYKGKGHKFKGYDDGYGDYKDKGHKLKLFKKPKKGYGVPYSELYGSDGYSDYKRKGKVDNIDKDMSMSGSIVVPQAELKEAYTSSQGPPIPLSHVEQPKKPEPSKSVETEKVKPVNRSKGDDASLGTYTKTTPKPKYSVQVTKPKIKLRTTPKPSLVSITVKTETGFQPMFNYDSSEVMPDPPARDGWAPVKFY